MSGQSFNPFQDDEIYFKDVLYFLMESWKKIAMVGLLGLFSSFAWLLLMPSHYEAIAYIKLVQFDGVNQKSSLGIKFEDINTLIFRLKLPGTFSDKEVQACNPEKSKFSTHALDSRVIKLNVSKSVPSLIELKIRGESKDVALTCAQAIFEFIRDSQNATKKLYIEELRSLLLKNQSRINDLSAEISKKYKRDDEISVAYLINRDDLRFFLNETIRLNALLALGDEEYAKLISPTTVSDNPVSPNKISILVLGFFCGMLLGLLYAFFSKARRNYKSRYNSQV